MIDIYDLNFNKNDLVFKDYESVRVKNLLVNKGFYKYFPDVGVELDFWIKSDLSLNFNNFSEFLTSELKKYKVKIKSVEQVDIGDSVKQLQIKINLESGEEFNNAL